MQNVNVLFKSQLKVVNIGLEGFYNSTKEQGTPSIQVDWRPPAGGNEKLLAILAKLNK
ncbi:fdrA domain protein [Natronincola ferrireducens]|uniref:FdrA protein n=1 Tax=Natronincola ferrireducens TaxID=393762 RepID=A0A1G9G0G9_9FIRM|nr:fdrA domain protein [Natronincola ferrireducens]SDK94144.1 FdrA protein [Natronincola ferrireducens]